VTINFAVVSRSLTHEFVSTWLSADDMSAGEVANNLTVLFSTVGVAVMGGLVMLFSFRLDERDALESIQKAAKAGREFRIYN